ncbi:MAG: hypothetical protein ACPGLY_11485 [Rubripirellula sp.]
MKRDLAQLQRLLDMQQRSYRLLKWMANAVTEGFVSFETAHDHSELPEAAEAWIRIHYRNIPPNARPANADFAPFCDFFSTYLTNSFELVSNPGRQRYSPDAHCFCPMCSWLMDAPNLITRKLQPSDKRRADTMRRNALLKLAIGNEIEIDEGVLAEVLRARRAFEDASLVAYADDLIQRDKGIANGPAVLALWRGFAWNEMGSPKYGFRLKASLIVEAEERLCKLLQASEPT